ncbi:hypothetical protein NVV95_13925 [Herbiconiux sp. CPCC 205716]|uniref:IPT/TIG domain-containing protein n=1 Tax=Herbiconiux gentiana TaxID=2970912 RepID=A0ABT2GHF0_9MICO|nr:hypothetical protein [Herbiconiux gentiana]MCS5715645.1 hypothetical protein [Herbiconiux gentiana]
MDDGEIELPSRRAALRAGAWSLPIIAVAVAAPAAVASDGGALKALPVALSAYPSELFPPVTISGGVERAGQVVVLVLRGATFSNGVEDKSVQLDHQGSVVLSDILAPATAMSGFLVAIPSEGPTYSVEVPLTTLRAPAGYDFVDLTARTGSAYAEVVAAIRIDRVPVPIGATLDVDFDTSIYAFASPESNPQTHPIVSVTATGVRIVLQTAVPVGMLRVSVIFSRITSISSQVTVRTDFGSSPALGPTTRSVTLS